MAEAWRKDEPLTTADLAGTKTRPSANNPGADTPDIAREDSDSGARPLLVRNESRDSGSEEMAADSSVNRDAVSTDLSSDGTAGREWKTNPGESGVSRETSGGGATPLLSDREMTDLRSKWTDIQAGFVDEPRRSVEKADQLVASAIQRLAEGFARERASLETQWEKGSDVSTEDLRLALQRYRSFFGRLLNAA